MAETKKKTTTKKTATKKVVPKKPNKTPKKEVVKKEEKIDVAKENNRLTNEAAFSVWVDILILIFIVLMFAVVLYGYIIAK